MCSFAPDIFASRHDRHIKTNHLNNLQGALQETELDRFQVPEDAAAEEDQLRAAREAKEKQQIKVRNAAVNAIYLVVCMQPQSLAVASVPLGASYHNNAASCLARLQSWLLSWF